MLWLVGIALFDMFLVNDHAVAPGDFWLYLICRLCVLTPACLLMLYVAHRSQRFYNVLMGAMPVAMSATLAFLLMMCRGTYRADYLFGDIMIMMCGCSINGSPLAYATASVLLQSIVFNMVLFGSDIDSSGGKLLHVLFCMSGAVVALITSYTLERDRRRAFLLSLRVRLLNRELEEVAMTDPLTGLANRRRLVEVTNQFWGKPAASAVSIILIDIDHFKTFNDRHGHVAGDACLKSIALQVSTALRNRDLAVRFGGEELLVFLPETGFEAARLVAESIGDSIRAAEIPHPALGENAIVTASLGVHAGNTRDCTVKDLIMRADGALYEAKAAGRNRVWPPAQALVADGGPDVRRVKALA